MGIFYHCAPIKLGVGSVIEPGNWGRVISAYSYRHNFHQREMVFEHVRNIVRPAAPSRLACQFALATLNEAISYCVVNDQKSSLIYECEMLDQDAPTFIAPLNAFSLTGGEYEMALQYWNASLPFSEIKNAPPTFLGVGQVSYELLTLSRMQIVGAAVNPYQ